MMCCVNGQIEIKSDEPRLETSTVRARVTEGAPQFLAPKVCCWCSLHFLDFLLLLWCSRRSFVKIITADWYSLYSEIHHALQSYRKLRHTTSFVHHEACGESSGASSSAVMEAEAASKMKQSRLPFQVLAVSPAQAGKKRKLGLEDLKESPCKSARSDTSSDVENDRHDRKEQVEPSGEVRMAHADKPSGGAPLQQHKTPEKMEAAVDKSMDNVSDDKGNTSNGGVKGEPEEEIVILTSEEEGPVDAQETGLSHNCVSDSTPKTAANKCGLPAKDLSAENNSEGLQDDDAEGNVITDTTTSEDLNSSVVSTSAADESGLGSSQLSTSTPKTPRRAVGASAESRKALRGEVAKRKQEEKEKRRAEKEVEKEKKKQLREQKRREKEQQLEEKKCEKERKQKEIAERRREIEEQKREREQRRLELQQEQENLKRQKVERQAARLEELKKKEEDKKHKLEEKKRAEEEAEKEKQKLKVAFESFFVKRAKSSTRESTENPSEGGQGAFRPFEPKQGMTLAPPVPPVALERFNKEALDQQMGKQVTPPSGHYLAGLRAGKVSPYRTSCKNEKPKEEGEDDVVIVDTESSHPKERLRAKLLQFCENVRPPYWGTWRKSTDAIGGRRPFARHMMLDYEVDSDEEWEEEEPGESLSGTEEEKESEDDYEVDNEFFVPHGYLSEDEEKDGDDPVSPESMKARLKARQEEFQADMKQSCRTLQPLVIGCTWQGISAVMASSHDSPDPLAEFAAVFVISSIPIVPSWEADSKPEMALSSTRGTKARSIPQEAMPHLIRMLHGNTSNKIAILQKFTAFWEKHAKSASSNPSATPSAESGATIISKRQFVHTIRSIARYSGNCWVVNQETLDKYELGDLELPQKATRLSQEEPRQEEPKEPAKVPQGALHKYLTSSPSVKRSYDEEGLKEQKQAKKPITGAISKFLSVTMSAHRKEDAADSTQEAEPNGKEVGTSSDPIVLDDSSCLEVPSALGHPPSSVGEMAVAEKDSKAKNSLEKYFLKASPPNVLKRENLPCEKAEEIVCV